MQGKLNSVPLNPGENSEDRNLRADIVLLACTLLVSFIFCEIVLRVIVDRPGPAPERTGWAMIPERTWIEYDHTLGWFQQKNKEAVLEKNGGSITINTNSMGLRGVREYAPAKPAGMFRIYALGDSFTFGFGVKNRDSFPAQMEAMNPALEVMNMGVPGYGIDQIYLLLKQWGMSHNPDLVLVTIYPEDFWRATRAFNDAGYAKPYFKIKGGGLELANVPVPREKSFDEDQFPDLGTDSFFHRLFSKSLLYRYGAKAIGRILKKTGLTDPDSSTEWVLGRRILKAINEYAVQHQTPAVFILAPPIRWITGTTEPVRESFLRLCEREGLHCLDLTPEFQKEAARQSVDNLYIPDDHHWTSEGNRVAARAILEEITPYFRKSHPA